MADRLHLHPYTEQTVTDIAELRQQLAIIRQQGYAHTHGELQVGAAGLAVPIFAHAGALAGGLGVVGPTHRFTPDRVAELLPLVLEAGVQISRRLGFRVPS